jgi:hypothetical protein
VGDVYIFHQNPVKNINIIKKIQFGFVTCDVIPISGYDSKREGAFHIEEYNNWIEEELVKKITEEQKLEYL